MKSVRRRWNSSNGGPRNENVAAAGMAASQNAGDSRKREVIARLRARYGEARELVATQNPDAESYGHLEWILGTRRDLGRDDSGLAAGVSELVVLWLQDLASQLDSQGLPPSVRDDGESATTAAESRRAVARSLRVATHDFAEAFLSLPSEAMGKP
jgi:hypothetical protein